MDYEQGTAFVAVVSHVTLTPFIMSRHLKVALVAGALLGLVAYILMWWRKVNLMLYTHYVPGLSVLIVAREVLSGDGGCVNTRRVVGPLLIFIEEAFIAEYLAIKVYSPRFYSLSHNLLHMVVAGWVLSFLVDHIVRRCAPAHLHALRVARQVYDPSAMACLGVLIISHQHDESPIGEFFHNAWGVLFLCMAFTHLLSSMVHAAMPVDAPLALIFRSLHACTWLANGLWACLMGLWMNLWGDSSKRFQWKNGSGRWTGAREVIFPAIGQDMPSAFEEGWFLLAFTLWLAGAVIAGLLWQGEGVHIKDEGLYGAAGNGAPTCARCNDDDDDEESVALQPMAEAKDEQGRDG